MALPKNRTTFTDYCLRKLGAPVNQINVDDDQISDRIDEAVQHARQSSHFDFIEHELITYAVTQEDIDANSIPLDDDIIGVIDFVTRPLNSTFDWMTNIGQMMKDIAYDISGTSGGSCGTSLGDYQTASSYMADVNFQFNSGVRWDFHTHLHKLRIHDDLSSTMEVGDFVLIEVYKQIDTKEYPSVWSDRWLIEYSTALIGQQWGVNLSKYDGVQLPGGITLDGDKVYDRYTNEIVRLEEQLADKYTQPNDFFVGSFVFLLGLSFLNITSQVI